MLLAHHVIVAVIVVLKIHVESALVLEEDCFVIQSVSAGMSLRSNELLVRYLCFNNHASPIWCRLVPNHEGQIDTRPVI